jgi:hypothetical protein
MVNDMSNQMTARDEVRIKHNLNRLLDFKADWDHFSWRADYARKQVARAVADLRSAGGIEEANRIVGADFK